ncbi:APC family permease [Luteithermobacter gelatinilyticus]|uniref:APC family permease n=1 Tax=Luteithermobacter gelatinilyticus TaxID=2582913 RepID=UPI001106D49A|nr:APC family permease [Luteithermobacter gelatinilyticus]
MKSDYKENSITLTGAVSMGTGVMIGAGIFALTGQVAELAGSLFPLAFIVAAILAAFSAYSYIKLSRAYPSAGGIAMYLKKAYGRGTMTGACALLMAFSMIINESLVARTFGTYTLQLFTIDQSSFLVPVLGVGLLAFAYVINISGNRSVGIFSFLMAFLKIVGILVFAIAGLWIADSFIKPAPMPETGGSWEGFLAALALAILAYKGFTTITNSGSEVIDPHRNIGRAIIISIIICAIIYLLVALAIGANLSLPEIIAAKDFALAEAARPALGNYGLWFTVALAIIATASGVIASVFAVSRMLTMLTEMKMIPHRHFGMGGRLQHHLLVYTIVLAMLLTIFFDLSRIAALGAIFYLIMDMAIHWGVLRHLRRDVAANPFILVAAIILDLLVLIAFLKIKAETDSLIFFMALGILVAIFAGERYFLQKTSQKTSQQTSGTREEETPHHHH